MSMETVQAAIMQKILKMMVPTSPAYNNSLAFERPTTPHELQQLLEPGDIIFSRTNSSFYEIGRKYMGMKYDHVAVVINPREVIHISPPIIGKLGLQYIVDPRREPMIIRPKLEDKSRFLVIVNNYLGEKYNLNAISQIGLRELKHKLKKEEKVKFSLGNLKHSRICSDSVLYALIKANPTIEHTLEEQLPKTKFQTLGFFLPDEVAQILLANDAQIILKSKFQTEYRAVDVLSRGGEKAVKVAQKVVEVGSMGSEKLAKLMSKYRVRGGGQNKEESKQGEGSWSAVQSLELLTLLMALGHALGVVTLSNKTRFLMLVFNVLMIVGHFRQMKRYIRRNLSHL